jgi:hypothetical protein
MSFQAYLDNIHAKTGLSPAQFRVAARKRGLVGTEVRATEFTDWLATDFGLGLGHGRALWTFFKREGWVGDAAAAAGAKKSSPTKKATKK